MLAPGVCAGEGGLHGRAWEERSAQIMDFLPGTQLPLCHLALLPAVAVRAKRSELAEHLNLNSDGAPGTQQVLC